jgi:small ligand-binding sensory domain FIST
MVSPHTIGYLLGAAPGEWQSHRINNVLYHSGDYMRIQSFVVQTADELDENLQKYQGMFSPTLALLFTSPLVGIEECADTLRNAGIPAFCCSTAGEILVGTGPSAICEQSAVCCLLDPPSSAFAIRLFDRGGGSSLELGRQIGRWGAGFCARPAFLLAISGLTNDGEAIIRGMQSVLPAGTIIAGGIAGDDNAFEQTATFSHEGLTYDGAVVLALDTGHIKLSSFTTSGWQGVGNEMTVTSAEGNVVRSIDGRPPVDLVTEYLNIPKEEIIATALIFPMLVTRPDGSETLRTALSADFETGYLTYAGSVPEGSIVRFSSSFGFETIAATTRELREYHGTDTDADLLVLFDCCARHQAAGARVNDEVLAIVDCWKAPLIGFFTYGEIGHTRTGSCDVFNETLSLALLKFR